jgi:hypothetical protein
VKCEFNWLGTSSWNIISWGTLPRSHANPTSPCLVRALRRRVAGCRGRLRQRPSLRLCCGSSLSRSPRLRFFFPVIFFKNLVCCNEFFFSCCAAYCCDFNFFLILGGGGGGLSVAGSRWSGEGFASSENPEQEDWEHALCMLRGSGARWGYGKRFSIGFGGTYHFRSLGGLWILLLAWWWLWWSDI